MNPENIDLSLVLEKTREIQKNNVNIPCSFSALSYSSVNVLESVWPEKTERCLILLISRPGQENPYGVLILGISPRLQFDEKYRSFFRLIGDHAATAIANAHAYETERKRAEALLEINKSKTIFKWILNC